MITDSGEKERRNTLRLVLLAVTAVVYAQVAGAGFINYDDGAFISGNSHSNSGFSLANLIWAFTTLHGGTSYYHPLTWLSYQLDTEIFGLRPGTVHLTNLLLHLANSVLLFNFLLRATGFAWRSFMVAALFALHPLHVESVCWTSERKTLVCAFFWLLAMLAHLRYAASRRPRDYAWVLLAFTASAISKPMAVTLPLALLLLDYWPLGRLRLPFIAQEPSAPSGCSPTRTGPTGFPTLLLEKVPMLAVAGLVSCLTYFAQKQLGAVAPLDRLPLWIRLANSVVAYALYLRKMLWPADLAPIYPLHVGWAWWEVGGALLFIVAVSSAALGSARRQPWFLFGWLWFLGTLVPMIGLVQVGSQGLADRYTYISLIGPFIIIVWGGAGLFEAGSPQRRRLLTAAGALCLLACALATAVQASFWNNSTALFSRATRATTDNSIAETILGLSFGSVGNYPEAELHLRRSLLLHPNDGRVYARIAQFTLDKGDHEGAARALALGLELSPDDESVHYNLAKLYLDPNRPAARDPSKAALHAEEACKLTRRTRMQDLSLLARAYYEAERNRDAEKVAKEMQSLAVSSHEIAYVKSLLRKIATSTNGVANKHPLLKLATLPPTPKAAPRQSSSPNTAVPALPPRPPQSADSTEATPIAPPKSRHE